MADDSPKLKNVDLTKLLKTGIAEIDEYFSGNADVPVGQLHVFVAASPSYKSMFWKQALDAGWTPVIFDLECPSCSSSNLEMAPGFGPEDVGVEPPDDPPDDPTTPKPGS